MNIVSYNTNPFIRDGSGIEYPIKKISPHWVTEKYGFEAFMSHNICDTFIYFKVGDKFIKTTQEFLDDIESAKFFNNLNKTIMNNTQFKVGQEFKDKGGYLLRIVTIGEERFADTNEPYQMVVLHREYLGDTEVTVRIGTKLQSFIDSGELTEVKKLSAAERMLEDIEKTDSTQFGRVALIQTLRQFICQEKNG